MRYDASKGREIVIGTSEYYNIPALRIASFFSLMLFFTPNQNVLIDIREEEKERKREREKTKYDYR